MSTTVTTLAQNSSIVSGIDVQRAVASAVAQPRWYAVYTVVRHEKKVAVQMKERLVDHFLPTYHSVRRWKDRQKEIELPLFPGYVFVRTDLQDRLRILGIPGVVHIVSVLGRPVPLPEEEIDVLMRRPACGRLEPHPFLSVGRRVRIRSGPFAGLEGILARRKDRLRVVLSIELIMRAVAVEVDEADIEPVA